MKEGESKQILDRARRLETDENMGKILECLVRASQFVSNYGGAYDDIAESIIIAKVETQRAEVPKVVTAPTPTVDAPQKYFYEDCGVPYVNEDDLLEDELLEFAVEINEGHESKDIHWREFVIRFAGVFYKLVCYHSHLRGYMPHNETYELEEVKLETRTETVRTESWELVE